MTNDELNQRIEAMRANCPPSDGAHIVQRHEWLDIDPDLADRDYTAAPTATEATS